MTFQHTRSVLCLVMLWSAAACAVAGAAPAFSSAQLREDLSQLRRALEEMPPDLSRSADIAELDREFRRIDAEIGASAPLDREATWRLFARLNPILGDGHLFVGFLDWRGDTRAHLANGGSLFPFEVSVTPGCEVRVRGNPRSSVWQPHGHERILEVDGEPMSMICERMMARTHGDTRTFRADLLTRRFWFFYWKLYGSPASYDIRFDNIRERIKARTALPELLAAEASFERLFEFVTVGNPNESPPAAILTLGTFAWPDKDKVLAFNRTAFESLRRWPVKTLVIDLRDNGGGNDDQWIEGVMPYIATRPFRTASTYRKRVVTPDPAKGEVVGAVVDGEIESWYPPQPVNPLHFSGDVYVAIGPGTYSSAVVMATVMQDFGFAKVIGTGESVRANQSGGTRRTTLTHCGLIVVSPRFVLTRPSGKRQPVYLTPDIVMEPGQTLVDFAYELSK